MHNSLQQDFSEKFLYNHGKAVTLNSWPIHNILYCYGSRNEMVVLLGYFNCTAVQ